jgi:Fur family ferric uptake transcriptional regulator
MAATLTTEKVLQRHDIRRTNCRVDILHEFIGATHALSQPDLERAMGESYDRVTIYRTLTLYLDKGLIHKVLDDSGAMKYALCPDTCQDHAHNHEHVHFKCVTCGNTICIESVEVPSIKLPEGYQLQETNLLLSGVCKDCS